MSKSLENFWAIVIPAGFLFMVLALGMLVASLLQPLPQLH
jgi:hypothetical protein